MEAVADGAEASSIDVEDDESSFGIRDGGDSWVLKMLQVMQGRRICQKADVQHLFM